MATRLALVRSGAMSAPRSGERVPAVTALDSRGSWQTI